MSATSSRQAPMPPAYPDHIPGAWAERHNAMTMYFGWIVALVTTIAVIFPFSTGAPLYAKIATAAVSLAIGMAIAMLVGGAAARSTVKTTVAPGPYDLPEAYGRPYEPALYCDRPYERALSYDRPYPGDLGQPGADYR